MKLLSPIANPGKIVAAPVNYQLHLDESRADTGINFGTRGWTDTCHPADACSSF